MSPKTAKKPPSKKLPKKKESLKLQTPKGMHDALPADQPWRGRIRSVGKELAAYYGFNRIETPILEYAQLFLRGVGEDTDIVGKEMYSLKTKGGDELALRPEGTAAVMRSYIEHGLGSHVQPQKLFYEGPMFRHENPQAGRYRQHTQTGFEIIGGSSDPVYDAELISILNDFLADLKIKSFSLKINSIGCRVCRPAYKHQLLQYYRKYEKELCADCIRRMETNPLRLLDCKNEKCQPHKEHAPTILDKLCAICTRHFKGVLEFLEELGITYELDNFLVRGLDYYNRTVFEFVSVGTDTGSIAGGGRYDYLSEALGVRLIPAAGWAMGWERVIATMKIQEVKLPEKNIRRVFIVHVGDLAKKKSLKLLNDLRKSGLMVSEVLGKESLKAQLKSADREKAVFALILGQKEIYEENIIIRDLRTGLQETVRMDRIEDEIKKRWKLYME